QVSPERAVRMAVLIGVREAHALAGFQLELSRALYLQEEKLDRVRAPAEHRRAQRLAARVNLGTTVIRHHTSAIETAAQPDSARLGRHGGEIDDQQIVGYAVDRKAVDLAARAAAANDRLIVAGDDAAIAGFRAGKRIRDEIRLEEAARRRFVARLDGGGDRARVDERAARAWATGHECAQAGLEARVLPPRKRGERALDVLRPLCRRFRRRADRARFLRQLGAAGDQYNQKTSEAR